jgi:acyl-CoA thioesterase-1
MTSLKQLTLLVLIWTSGAIWGSLALAANPGERGRVVVLGDSITAGYGLEPSQAYPALLQKLVDEAGLSYEVVNAGVSGDTSSGGLRRIDWALKAGADVLIVALGGNDGLRGLAPAQTEANLLGIIQKARAKNPAIKIIVAGMQMPENMGQEYVEKFNGTFAKVATEAKAALVPFLIEGIGAVPEFNQPDLIHPNVEGQKRVAANVWKVLRGQL